MSAVTRGIPGMRRGNGTWRTKQTGGGVCGGFELMAPALQRRDNMSAKCCVSGRVSDYSVRMGRVCVSEWDFHQDSKWHHKARRRWAPIPCSPNLQMTLGVLSTYDESLPAWCDLFNPAEELGWRDTNHLDGSHSAAAAIACVRVSVGAWVRLRIVFAWNVCTYASWSRNYVGCSHSQNQRPRGEAVSLLPCSSSEACLCSNRFAHCDPGAEISIRSHN